MSALINFFLAENQIRTAALSFSVFALTEILVNPRQSIFRKLRQPENYPWAVANKFEAKYPTRAVVFRNQKTF